MKHHTYVSILIVLALVVPSSSSGPVGRVVAADPAASAIDPHSIVVVEEFNSSEGFVQTDPDVYIADGRANWHVYRNGGEQFIYRSIPPISGDVRLTVRGRVDGWTNNCAVAAGIGSAPGPGVTGLAGVSANFGFNGGGCATQGAVILGGGVQLDYQESGCNFTGNWLWINPQTYYTATLTLTGNSATLSVPGVGAAHGTRTHTGTYDKLFVGINGAGDWPDCWGAIDSITVESLTAARSGKAYLPLVLRGSPNSSVIVTPVQRTDASGNTTIHLPQADLQVTIKDAGGIPLANARVIAVTDGQRALVIGEDAQHRYYPTFEEVALPASVATSGDPDALPIIIPVVLFVVDAAVSLYGVYQFAKDPPEMVDVGRDYVDYCYTVEEMANTLGLLTTALWFIPDPTLVAGHVLGIVAGVGWEIWGDDLVTDYWCAYDLPHPALIRQYTYPDMETDTLKVLGSCPNRPQQPICQRSTSTLTGVVTNARTGTGVSGVDVQVSPSGPRAMTSSSGQYIINAVPVGYHTVTASREDYVPATKRVEVAATTTTANFDLSPVGSGAEYRFVLTWGENPQDLDSHLWLPTGYSYHVYYGQRGGLSAHPYAALDRDDMTSYGPETVTMIRSYAGTYQYAVHRFSGSGSLTTSDAKVLIYRGDTALRAVEVPTGGAGDWWVVASVDGTTGNVAVQNYITASYPGPYATAADDDK